MYTLLIIYTIVGSISVGSNSKYAFDWRPMGVFESPAACEKARESLGTEAKERARCLGGAIK